MLPYETSREGCEILGQVQWQVLLYLLL